MALYLLLMLTTWSPTLRTLDENKIYPLPKPGKAVAIAERAACRRRSARGISCRFMVWKILRSGSVGKSPVLKSALGVYSNKGS